MWNPHLKKWRVNWPPGPRGSAAPVDGAWRGYSNSKTAASWETAQCYFLAGTDKYAWQVLFSVPILTVTLLTVTPTKTLTLTLLALKTNLNPNPNPNIPNHNHTARMENSLEPIQLSVPGDGYIIYGVVFHPG